jgi:hypothetical protein
VRRADPADSGTRRVTLRGRAAVTGRAENSDVSSSMWSWTTFVDGVLTLGAVWIIPIAVLAVGIPVALAIAFLLWLVQLARGAF